MTNKEESNLQAAYLQKEESAPPAPWRPIQYEVEGVAAVGFGRGTELLLVLTASGLEVVDCATGAVVAEQDGEEMILPNPYPVFIPGIGPLSGQDIAVAGLWGGGLRSRTLDGWAAHRIAPNWPFESAVLCPPSSPEIDDSPEDSFVLFKDLPYIRAFGFSESGRVLVLADSGLIIWYRG